MKPRWIFALGALVLFVGAMPSHAQWSTDPTVNNAICTATNNQLFSTLVSAGAGGAIIAWQDYRSGPYTDIYAQRINASGVVQWAADGVVICMATNHQSSPTIVSDGAGGAIVMWTDYRSGTYTDIFAQRINASGVVQWADDGVAICTATNYQVYPTIASDGAGGAIITWQDYRSGTHTDIFAQRINTSGVVQWAADGVAICTATNDQWYPTIVSDGGGGAIITWQGDPSGFYISDIYAQRVNASGIVQWTADGVAICTAANGQWRPTIVSAGAGGAIITWIDERSSIHNPDIYAQRINASGIVQWTADGVAVCTATNDQIVATSVSDGAGGAIIARLDEHSGSYYTGDIYAQRINALGVVQWTTDGVAISTAAKTIYNPRIVTDSAGGAIITWQDYRNGAYDIYAQRINASGVMQWTADGVAICAATNTQTLPTIVSDGTGGAIITWTDYRSDNLDIYAQLVRSDGTLGGNSAPLADAGAVQTVIVNETVQLNGSGSSDPDGHSLTYSWVITSKPAGSNATLSNPSSVNPAFVADVAGEYTVSLTVNDGAVNSTPDEVIITVITAQDAVRNLINQVRALNKPQGNGLIGKLNVVIKRLDKNDIAQAIAMLQQFIDQVNVFMGNGTFTVAEGQPLVDAANAIIAALSNSAQAAGLKKDGSDGLVASGLPTGFQLAQNSPNPFNPTTTIQFSVPREGYVRLKVYNAFGAEVATLVDRQVAAGTYKVNWDASRLASGFYLYRLEAEGFTQTKKLLLTK